MKLRLPSFFKSPDAASPYLWVDIQGLAVSENGVFASVGLQNLLPLSKGRIGDGFEISIDQLTLTVCNTSIEAFGITGDLRLPIMGKEEALIYGYSRTPARSAQFTIGAKSGKEGFTFAAFGATAKICTVLGVLSEKEGKTELGVKLSGSLQVLNATDKLDLTFGFQSLQLTSTYPFVQNFALNIGQSGSCVAGVYTAPTSSTDAAVKLQVAGMDVSVGNLQVRMNQGELRAGASVSVNMDDKIAGTGDFVILAKLEKDAADRYSLTNTKLGIERVCVKGDFSAFDFEGCVSVVDRPDLGVGFGGKINFKLKLGGNGAGGEVEALFARKDTYKYWFLDASLDCNVPLTGPLYLNGINGAAYKNVSFRATSDAGQTQGGATASGLTFIPKQGSWGFRAGLLLAVKPVPEPVKSGEIPKVTTEMATIGGMIEVVGQAGEGIKKVSLFADLQLILPNTQKITIAQLKPKMALISAALDRYLNGETLGQNANVSGTNYKGTAVSNKNLTKAALKDLELFGKKTQGDYGAGSRLGADVLIAYNVDKRTLIGLIYPDISVGMDKGGVNFGVQSTGYGIFYFSPAEWYVHLGKQAWEDRLGLNFSVVGKNASLSAFVNGYFMIGTGIERLPTPHVPGEFASLFATKSTVALKERETMPQNYAAMRAGSGLALGAAAGLSVQFKLGKIVDCNLNAGAGFDVVLLNNLGCDKQVGWGQEPGQTQTGWGGQGQLYGYCSGNLKVMSVSLLDFGAGFSLRASVPKPYMAEGRVKVYVKVWFIKANLNVGVTVGEPCAVPLEDAVITYKFLESTAPQDKATDVSVLANLNVIYSDTIRTYAAEKPIRLQARVQLLEGTSLVEEQIKSLSENQAGKGNQASLSFVPKNALKPNTTYTLKVTSALYDGQSTLLDQADQPIGEIKTITFTTGEASLRLEKADVAAYPVAGQHNVYRTNWPGLLTVDPALSLKLAKACPGCSYAITMTPLTGPAQPVRSPDPDHIPDALTLVDRKLALDQLQPDQIYKLKILVTGAPGVVGEQVIYDDHYFRTSRFTTFQEKIAAYNAGILTETVNLAGGFPAFTLSLVGMTQQPGFEPFSREELDGKVLFEPVVPSGEPDDWFTRFERVMAPGGIINYFRAHPAPVRYTQQQQPYLEAGITRVNQIPTLETGPVWTFRPFEDALYDYVDQQSISSETALEPIPLFSGAYCLPVAYDPLRRHPVLQGRFTAAKSCLTLKVTDPIDLNKQPLLQYVVKVECQPDARDQKPLNFAITILNNRQEQTNTLDEDLILTIKNPALAAGLSQPVSQTSMTVTLLAGQAGQVFTSIYPSLNGCPVGADKYLVSLATPGKTFRSQRYQLAVSNAPYPPYSPFLTVRCGINDKEVNSSATGWSTSTNSSTYVNKNQLYVSYSTGYRTFQREFYVQVNAYEDEYMLAAQTLKAPTTVKLSNGKSCTIPAGGTGCQIQLTVDEHENCSRLSVLDDGSFTPGPNEATLIGKRFYPVAVSNTLASLEAICTAPTTYILYGTQPALAVGGVVQKDSTQGGPSPVDGYYRLANTATPTWFFVKGGKVTQTGGCSDTPYLHQVCVANPAYSATSGKSRFLLKLNLYTANTQQSRYIPYAPITVLLSTGQEYTIPVGADGEQTVEVIGSGCGLIAAVLPALVTYNQVVSANCTTLPPAPILAVSSATPAAYGQTLTLTATGCPGEVIWPGLSQKGTSITFKVLAQSRVRAICVQNGCLSSESAIDIQLVPLRILPPPTVVCRGRPVVLTAEGCGGTVRWQPGGLSGASVTVQPTVTTLYSITCLLTDGTVLQGPTATLSVEETPLPPTLTSTIPPGRANQVCITQSTVTLTASACSLGQLVWYQQVGDQSAGQLTANRGLATLTVTPKVSTHYWASCATDRCESEPAASLLIEVIEPPVPTLTTLAKEVTICTGLTTQLTASNCPYTVVWSDGQTGATITVSPRTTTDYTAHCRKDDWCQGTSSARLTLTVIDPASLALPVLAADKQRFCAYDQATLQVSGSYRGTIDWKTPGQTQWHQEGENLTALTARHEAGTYTYQVRSDFNGCFREGNVMTLTVDAQPSNPVLGTNRPNHTICAGEPITLTGSCATGTVEWVGLTNPLLTNLPAGTHTYTAQCRSVANCVSGQSTVVVRVNKVPDAPVITSSAGNPICAYTTTSLAVSGCSVDGQTGTYTWQHDPSLRGSVEQLNQAGTFAANCTVNGCTSAYSSRYQLVVHAKPDRPQLTASAAVQCASPERPLRFTASGCPGTYRWSDGDAARGSMLTVSEAGTYTYGVSCLVNNCESDVSATASAVIHPTPGPLTMTASSTVRCAGEEVTLTAATGLGTVRWLSEGNSTGATVQRVLTDSRTFEAQRVTDQGCAGPVQRQYIQVYPKPAPPRLQVSHGQQCTGEGVATVFTAAGCQGTYRWSDGNSTRGAQLPVSAAGEYTFSVACEEQGCQSGLSGAQTATLLQTPESPAISASPAALCQGEQVTLTVSVSSGSVRWISEGNSSDGELTQTPDQTHTYRAVCVSPQGCTSRVSEKTVTVSARPGAPTLAVSSQEQCYEAARAVQFTATGCAQTYVWSDGNATRGTSLDVRDAGTYTYTVRCQTNGCVGDASSERRAVITPTAGPLTLGSDQPGDGLCQGASIRLTATGCVGTVRWSDGEQGSERVFQPGSTTTYQARCQLGGHCDGPPQTLTVRVTPKPNPPTLTISAGEVCAGEGRTVQFRASGGAGTYLWSDGVADRGDQLTVDQPSTYAYSVRCAVDGCQSEASATQQATIRPVADPITLRTDKPANTLCAGETVTLTADGCRGQVSWSDGQTGGTRTFTPQMATTYRAYCVMGGHCDGASSTVAVVVRSRPDQAVVYAPERAYCAGGSVLLSVRQQNANDVVRWSIGATGGELRVTQGTYRAYIDREGCGGSMSADVVISEKSRPAPPTFSPANPEACPGSSIAVSAGENGLFVDTYTNVKAAGVGTHYAIRRVEGCDSERAMVTVGEKQVGSAPPISVANITFRSDLDGTLTATGCVGGLVRWNTGAEGVNLVVRQAGTYTATCLIRTDCGTRESTASAYASTVTPDTQPLLYTGAKILCNGATTTTPTFSGCANGAVSVYYVPNIQGSPQGNLGGFGFYIPDLSGILTFVAATPSQLTAGHEYYATCIVDGVVMKDTYFSILAQSSPQHLAISLTPNQTTIDRGTTIQLAASASGARSYAWNTDLTTEVIGDKPEATTTYTVTAYSETNQQGCTAQLAKTITVKEPVVVPPPCVTPNPPTIDNNRQRVAENAPVTLTAEGCAGTVIWSTGSTGTTIQIEPHAPGTSDNTITYTALCRVETCQSGQSNSIQITVVPRAGLFSDPVSTQSAVSCTSANWPRFFSETGEAVEIGTALYTETLAKAPAGWYAAFFDNADYQIHVNADGVVDRRTLCTHQR